jgi:hypothetical protein
MGQSHCYIQSHIEAELAAVTAGRRIRTREACSEGDGCERASYQSTRLGEGEQWRINTVARAALYPELLVDQIRTGPVDTCLPCSPRDISSHRLFDCPEGHQVARFFWSIEIGTLE